MFFSGERQDDVIDEIEQVQQPLLAPVGHPHPWAANPKKRWNTIALSAILLLVVDLGFFFTAAPLMEIIQDIICSKYHPGNAAGGAICKSEDVQEEVALVWGWLDTFNVLPGMYTCGCFRDAASPGNQLYEC